MSDSFINRTSRVAISGRVGEQRHRVLHAPFGKAEAITRVSDLFKPIMFRTLSLRGLWTDTDGFILPYVTVLLIVIVGMSALALDGARYVSLQTQLQNGADQLALAAAAELNAQPDAIDRANAALTTTLASFQQSTLFGTGAYQTVTIASKYYLSDLPPSAALPSDGTVPIPSSLHVTEDATGSLLAHFVEVTVTPVTTPTIFPVSFFGGSTFSANATAVAGFHKNVCEFTPMYVCNPYEAIGNTDYDAATQALIDNDVADPNALAHRQMITLRRSPGDFNSPGNYGFLQVPSLGGGLGGATRTALARVKPGTCLNASRADSQPGLGGGALADAFNVRFDIYQSAMNAHKNDADYAPAPNVRKGYTYTTSGPQNGPCNATPAADPTQAMALPVDNPAAIPPSPVGSGTWDFNTYWSVEHPGVAAPTVNGVLWGNTPPNLPSRYSVYNYEISVGTTPAPPPNTGGLMDRSPGNPTASPVIRGEIGAPECSTSTPAPVNRRNIQAAIINCQALTAMGILGGGRQTNIPIAAFGKFFTLQPADTSTGNFNAEFTGLARTSDEPFPPPNTVQLYR
jgi:Flp pilus assembly protein TadG